MGINHPGAVRGNMANHLDHPKYLTCMCDGCKIYRKEKGILDPHEKLVREIAETLNEKVRGDKLHLPFMEDAARAMVEKMADVWMDCWKLNNPYITDIEDGLEYAKQRGLFQADYDPEQQFPSPTKTGE